MGGFGRCNMINPAAAIIIASVVWEYIDEELEECDRLLGKLVEGGSVPVGYFKGYYEGRNDSVSRLVTRISERLLECAKWGPVSH